MERSLDGNAGTITDLAGSRTMKIQILGTGCAKCRTLTANTDKAIRELGLAAEIEKVEALADIARMGVMMTPALAVDGRVKSSGRLLSVHQVKQLLGADAAERE
jgi:small redox-active disulfide protein 2